jgi:hypothetical protein
MEQLYSCTVMYKTAISVHQMHKKNSLDMTASTALPAWFMIFHNLSSCSEWIKRLHQSFQLPRSSNTNPSPTVVHVDYVNVNTRYNVDF